MASTIANAKHSVERAAVGALIDGILKDLKNTENKRESYCKLADLAQKYFGKTAFPDARLEKVKQDLMNPDSRWIKFIDNVIDEVNPNFAKMTLLNLGYEAFLRGTKQIRANREKYNCNIPWLILFDPTSACNMHCKGCWSGTYGHKNNLSFEDMDKIITEGKELGVPTCT
jgi:hypothetical protein